MIYCKALGWKGSLHPSLAPSQETRANKRVESEKRKEVPGGICTAMAKRESRKREYVYTHSVCASSIQQSRLSSRETISPCAPIVLFVEALLAFDTMIVSNQSSEWFEVTHFWRKSHIVSDSIPTLTTYSPHNTHTLASSKKKFQNPKLIAYHIKCLDHHPLNGRYIYIRFMKASPLTLLAYPADGTGSWVV